MPAPPNAPLFLAAATSVLEADVELILIRAIGLFPYIGGAF